LKTREEKLIALKVLLSVQNISELSLQSRTFKTSKVIVSKNHNVKFVGICLVTPYVKQLSWLLYQLQYIFQDQDDSFVFLCESLKIRLAKTTDIKQISDFLLEESGKILG